MNNQQQRRRPTTLYSLLLIVVSSSLQTLDVVDGESTTPATVCGGSGSNYDYLNALLGLMIPCKAAVAPFSPAPPTEECCSAVRKLGRPCLCLLLAGQPISGVDRRILSSLPDRCGDTSTHGDADLGSCTTAT